MEEGILKISTAFRKAIQVYFGHLGASLKFLLVEACLLLICLAPLLFWTNEGLRPLCLLSVPLFVLVLLPARVNAAAAMQDACGEGSLFSYRLADTSEYGRKLGYGLSRLGLLLLWGAPLIACVIIAREHISGEMDGFTLLRMIRDFGGGDVFTGMVYLLLILAGAILVFAVGCGFHCGDRHAFVLGRKGLLKGKRWKALLCDFCALITLLPLVITLVILAVRYAPAVANVDSILLGIEDPPDTKVSLIILAVGFALTIPFFPLRSLVAAAWVNGLSRE